MTDNYKVIEKKAMLYCAKSEKCEHDIRQKLTVWGAECETVDKIIQVLYENQYLDKQRYANAFVNDAVKIKNWGRLKIKQALQLKKIDSAIIRQAIETIDKNMYEQKLRHIVEQRVAEKIPSYEEKMKIVKSIHSRGYESDIILRILNLEM